ncbi:uncharacterized protein LOC143936213 [Lithobates pipiens]
MSWKPKMEIASVKATRSGLLKMIDTFDRPHDEYTEDMYARAGTYAAGFTNKPGERIPKAGVYAEAGVYRARTENSIFEAEAKGPNASIRAGFFGLEVGAMARAELGSASASAGPFTAKLGLGLDTGVSAEPDYFEAKFLGTGFSIGSKTSISYVGSEVECVIQ